MRDVAREHRTRAGRVGEVLVSWGKLTREQLRAVLDLEKNDHRRLGEILLSKTSSPEKTWRVITKQRIAQVANNTWTIQIVGGAISGTIGGIIVVILQRSF